MADPAADLDHVTKLALGLAPAARELVAYRIWESLRPEAGWLLDAKQLVEVERRVAEVESGSARLVDGEAVMASLRARVRAATK